MLESSHEATAASQLEKAVQESKTLADFQKSVENYKLWGELRLQLMCQRFQESTTTGEGKVTQPTTGFKVNEIKDLGDC